MEKLLFRNIIPVSTFISNAWGCPFYHAFANAGIIIQKKILLGLNYLIFVLMNISLIISDAEQFFYGGGGCPLIFAYLL